MKKILLLLLFNTLGLSIVYCQNYELEYEFRNHITVFNKTKIYVANLLYNKKQDKSLYTVEKKMKNTKANSLDDNTIVLSEKNIDDELVYNDFKDSITIIQEQVDIEMFLFKEKTPKIDWIILDETKKENNLNLRKATTSFRGRNYTVWYSMDIPITVGPWKFNGLPGAIVSIEEDKKRYSWILKSFKKSEDKLIENPIENTSYLLKDIKDYPILKFETSERVKNKLREIDSNFTFPKKERLDIELIFEWEK